MRFSVKKLYKINKEDAELIAFFDWVRWQQIRNPMLAVIHHVQNEGKTTLAQGARNKAKGKRAGVPDITVPIPNGKFHGLYIELKTTSGKISAAQKEFITLLHGLGYCVRVAFSSLGAIDILKDYLKERVTNDVRH